MTHPKGSAREKWVIDQAEAGGILAARRSQHGGAGRDVDVRADVLRIIEVKDRQQLNAHKTVAHTIKHHPDYPPSLIWHRVSKPKGAKRSTPDGPTLAMLPVYDYFDLLNVATAVEDYLLYDNDIVDRRRLVGAVEAIQARYPKAYGAFK